MKFFAVKHICGNWSVGTKAGGCGIALDFGKPWTKKRAKRAAKTANKAIEIYNHKPNHEYCD